MNVPYTNEEADAAIKLYDLAVRNGGLQVAEAALVLTRKLQDAAKAEPVKEDTSE